MAGINLRTKITSYVDRARFRPIVLVDLGHKIKEWLTPPDAGSCQNGLPLFLNPQLTTASSQSSFSKGNTCLMSNDSATGPFLHESRSLKSANGKRYSVLNVDDVAAMIKNIFNMPGVDESAPDKIVITINNNYGVKLDQIMDLAIPDQKKVFEHALEKLQFGKIVTVGEFGKIQKYEQERIIIKTKDPLLDLKEEEPEGLLDLIDKIYLILSKAGLFQNIDFYMRDGRTGEVKIVKGDCATSSFKAWKVEREGGVFNKLFVDSLRNRGAYFHPIADVKIEAGKKDGIVSVEDIAKYEKRWANLGAIGYSLCVFGDNGDAVALKFHEWGNKVRPFYSPNLNAKVNGVNSELNTLTAKIADLFHTYLSSRSGTLKETYDGEILGGEGAISERERGERVQTTAIQIKTEQKYLQESVPIVIKRKAHDRKVKVTIEPIKLPSKALAGRIDKVVSDLYAPFDAAWGNVIQQKGLSKNKYLEFIKKKCIETADKIMVVRYDGKIGGFSTINVEQVDDLIIFNLGLTVLDPVLQELRLSTYLNKTLLVEAWLENRDRYKDRRLPIVVRTATPRLVGALTSSLSDIFPDPYHPEKKPSPLQLHCAKTLAKRWSPHLEFDEEHFVSKGALLDTLGFLFKEDRIQLYRDPEVNAYCTTHLNNEKGDAFILFGWGSIADKNRSALKNWGRAFESFWKRGLITFKRSISL